MDDIENNDKPLPDESLDSDNPEAKNDLDNSPSASSPNPENADTICSDIKDDNEKLQKSSFLPPDLNKVSEEIDRYISILSTSNDNEFTSSDVPIFIEKFAVLVESKIEDYENHVKWSRVKDEEATSFLETVNRVSSLSKALSRFSSEYKYTYTINSIGGVLQHAMSYLEEEFRSLLDDYKPHDRDHHHHAKSNDRKHRRSSSSSSNKELDENVPPESATPSEDNTFIGYSEEILSHLIQISKAMMDAGYETECCGLYFVARRNALEERLHRLGFEKYSIDDVQKMHWESLEREILTWIKAFKNFADVQLTGERKLCDLVFSDHLSLSQGLICSLFHGVTIQILNFAEAVALTKRAAEKLFKFLDIYEALRDNLFPEEWENDVKTQISMIKTHLGEAVVSIFVELESSIKADSGKTPVPGGAVHPLTRYTMNYLKYVCEYNETLEQVFRDHQKIERADSGTGSEFHYNPQANQNHAANQSPFQSQMIKVMDLLDANLENKSKLYKDPSLKLIFMMNNGRYILQKFKGSNEINSLMGDSWYRRKSSDLRQYHKGYQRESWGKLLNCLQTEGLMTNGKIVKPAVKERFKSFNATFDEIHKIQSSWVVSDEQLRSELRVSISNMVIPAYRSFLGRFSPVFTPGRQTEKYVKYQPEEIESLVDDLFDGGAATMARWKL